MPVKPTLERWSQAWNKGDLRALVDLYSHDALILHPTLPSVQGRPAIREFFNGAVGQVHSEFYPSEIQFCENIGYEWGEFRDKDPQTHKLLAMGTYVVTWVHRDGAWLIKTHAWNDLSAKS